MSKKVCSIVEDRNCLAPANVCEAGRVNIKTECFACGNPVCRNCSRIRKWYSYGKQRICLDCIEESKK